MDAKSEEGTRDLNSVLFDTLRFTKDLEER